MTFASPFATIRNMTELQPGDLVKVMSGPWRGLTNDIRQFSVMGLYVRAVDDWKTWYEFLVDGQLQKFDRPYYDFEVLQRASESR